MLVTWGQSAWVVLLLGITQMWNTLQLLYSTHADSSETTRETSQALGSSKSTKEEFHQWLVGVVDGDGTFHFSEHVPGKCILYFKVGQNTYNLRMLHYIKRNLGIGQVAVSGNMAEYRLRDRTLITQVIFPIFDKYPLLTSKYYYYDLFKQAAMVMSNTTLSSMAKHELLNNLKIKTQSLPTDYVSPAWAVVNNQTTNIADALLVMSKSWIVGFTEAEGSFYLTRKNVERIVHGYEVTQKLDAIVLIAISHILGIKFAVKKTYNTVYTTSARDIPRIIQFFHNTMVGMKSLEYRIWARSFNKSTIGNKKYDYLLNVQAQMRAIRSIRLDKNFKIKS